MTSQHFTTHFKRREVLVIFYIIKLFLEQSNSNVSERLKHRLLIYLHDKQIQQPTQMTSVHCIKAHLSEEC